MTSIETFYLIDFENVHEEGLNGADKLGAHDHVHFFSTRNAPKISFQILKDFNSAHLYSHEIPVGRQSLDMHLVSYLGYLIAEHKNQKCRYVIVSQDTDYDNIISFWKEELGISISDFIREKKIEKAQNPLRYCDFSLIEISAYLSFSSQSHFIQSFKKLVGMTPKKYRDLYYATNWPVRLPKQTNPN